jgi:hypothetical protein
VAPQFGAVETNFGLRLVLQSPPGAPEPIELIAVGFPRRDALQTQIGRRTKVETATRRSQLLI